MIGEKMTAHAAMSTAISVERKINALARVARSALAPLRENCCVAATKLGIDLLESWSVQAKPLYCTVAAENADKSYAVTIDDSSLGFGEGLCGHLVIAGKAGSQKFLLDLSAYQMDRPKRGIIITSGVLAPRERPIIGSWAIGLMLPQGGHLFYKNHPREADREWESAGDWRLHTLERRWNHEQLLSRLRAAVDDYLTETCT